MSTPRTVFIQVVDRPARGFILKRGRSATEYFEYCEEVGCDIWPILTGIRDALYEPIGAWMPPQMTPHGTSSYVQGVEVPLDYAGPAPEGFDRIDLPACQVMVFQGPPFKDEDGPRFQIEPQGYRGYIEARPVRPA